MNTTIRSNLHIVSPFGQLGPDEYHQWRVGGEFFSTIEAPAVMPHITLEPFERALDIGCGTGLWAGILHSVRPSAEIVGCDVDEGMIDYATAAHPRIRFQSRDAMEFRDEAKFDTIVAAMSADYIGFELLADIIASNMRSNGVAFVWFLDSSRYELRSGRRVKRWEVGDRRIEVDIADYTIPGVLRAFGADGLICLPSFLRFRLLDDTERMLVLVEVRHEVSAVVDVAPEMTNGVAARLGR